MGVKVRFWSGKWYVVIHYNRERTTLKMDTKAQAYALAEIMEKKLALEGLKAFREMQRGGKAQVPTVKEFSERWLAELGNSNLKPSTFKGYETNLRLHLLPIFGRLRLDVLDYARVKAFVIAKAQGPPTLSRNTVRLMVATLRAMLNEAIEEGILSENPCRRLGKHYGGAPRSKKPDPFSREEMVAIETMATQRFAPYYEFVVALAHTGMRVGECQALMWSDLDTLDKSVRVERNFPSTLSTNQVATPKTAASKRAVHATDELLGLLKSLKRKRREQWLEKGSARIPKWMFCTSHGTPYLYANLRKVWVRLLGLSEVRYRSFHHLRHTFASELLAQGVPPTYVSEQLGHKNVHITNTIYAHWIKGDKRRYVHLLESKGQKSEQEGLELPTVRLKEE